MIKICFTGDSISSALAANAINTVGEYIARQIPNCTVRDICYPSDALSNQTTKWNGLSDAEKLEFDFVFSMNGHNDVNKSTTFTAGSGVIGAYDTFYALLRSKVKSSCKIFSLTSTPCLETEAVGDRAAYSAMWILFNDAKRGLGSTPISGFDYYIDEHTTYLDNGSQSLKSAYYASGTDKLHMNAAGIKVVADACVQKLRALNLI